MISEVRVVPRGNIKYHKVDKYWAMVNSLKVIIVVTISFAVYCKLPENLDI